jgi:hypothetical protein
VKLQIAMFAANIDVILVLNCPFSTVVHKQKHISCDEQPLLRKTASAHWLRALKPKARQYPAVFPAHTQLLILQYFTRKFNHLNILRSGWYTHNP